jgi:hypothetical protein
MSSRPYLLLALALVSACGKKIGDSCQLPSDCSNDNSRICELNSPDGYCTIVGCDFGTCPSEAVCVRFYPGLDNAPPCATQSDCAFDQICTVAKVCAPRSVELRFCMLSCGSNDDCREGYECRDAALMKAHGGEPVPDPNAPPPTGPPPDPTEFFCAQRRPCQSVTQCPVREQCDSAVFCAPRNACDSNANCAPQFEVCDTLNHVCARPCTGDLDCDVGETCNLATQICDPIHP